MLPITTRELEGYKQLPASDAQLKRPSESLSLREKGLQVMYLLGMWSALIWIIYNLKELGHWPDAPFSGTRASVFFLLAVLGTPAIWYFMVPPFLRLTGVETDGKSEPKLSKAMCLATLCVFLTWFFVKPNTCAGGELNALIRVPESLKLPVTTEVLFRGPTRKDYKSKALTIVLAGNELGIAHQLVTNTSSSFRIAYDFENGLASSLRNSTHSKSGYNATFSDTEMHLFLPGPGPSPGDDILFVLDGGSGTVRDASLYGGGESIVRFANKRKGRVCLAKFDRTGSRAALARVAFPLGLVMHGARHTGPRFGSKVSQIATGEQISQ